MFLETEHIAIEALKSINQITGEIPLIYALKYDAEYDKDIQKKLNCVTEIWKALLKFKVDDDLMDHVKPDFQNVLLQGNIDILPEDLKDLKSKSLKVK